MTRGETLAIVLNELKNTQLDERINLLLLDPETTSFKNLRLDSLDSLQFAMNLEIKLGIEFDISNFPLNASIGELTDYLLTLKDKSQKNLG
jgi:acyl carrier protein